MFTTQISRYGHFYAVDYSLDISHAVKNLRDDERIIDCDGNVVTVKYKGVVFYVGEPVVIWKKYQNGDGELYYQVQSLDSENSRAVICLTGACAVLYGEELVPLRMIRSIDNAESLCA